MEEHLPSNRQKKEIQHVIEKFQKRGIKISACKPRALLTSCLAAADAAKNHE
ncbi:hypothetical protein [Anoxybacillus sp. J5B_2022]|uniref:hypothetical protein n=1 Tax=Anoxybacillus sp. J5B_2022 TaxID=3003246 RepID=UPI0022857760|nr:MULTISPECIES: hypothetical protein [unclassified Anoxybacillus]MCL6587197.1 hypothetical protein [Anoxybacillus sp.]MCZ0754498.1 hypothetical protein [Anoxybacillus sp. J5B_2022]